MISFKKHTLPNGLRLIIHEDTTTPNAVLNLLYDVGARDESPDKTGFAHLFEHLMFGGSVNIPKFDAPLQAVGGENNAFTSNDLTNYYMQLPADNIETAFWLESDRMLSLAFSEKSLEVQRNVVCEEFKQRYLNQPYGDVWLLLRPLAYTTHPYNWATIGKELSHVEDATIEDVKAFFQKHYNPQNAILCIAGNITEDKAVALTEKWFGPIAAGNKYNRNLPTEPTQTEARSLTVHRAVPQNAIYKAYKMAAKNSRGYYLADVLTDILAQGKSARLYNRLVKDLRLFSTINAYVMGSFDEGLLVVEGKIADGITVEAAEAGIKAELEIIKNEMINEEELLKIKNRLESSFLFAEMNLLNKAMNLCFAEVLGDAENINHEMEKYQSITAQELQAEAQNIFDEKKCSTLYYLKEK